MDEYLLFEAFGRVDYIPQEQIKKLQIILLRNSFLGLLIVLIMKLNITTQLYHVCRWREEHGFATIAKKGENICNNELVNFFKDEAQKNCVCSRA